MIGDRFDRFDHLVRVREALARILGECAHHQIVDAARQRWIDGGGRRRIEAHDRGERLVVGAALERADVRDHLVEDDAEREQIAALIELVRLTLLGRQVRDLAHDRPGLGLRVAVARFRDAEVEDLHGAVEADHQVRRRDVAMDDVERLAVDADAFVRVRESGARARRDGERDMQRHALAQSTRSRQHVENVFAVDELHRVEERVTDLTEVEDLRDVRVLQLRREARFVEEHRDPPRIVIALGTDAFEHDVPLETRESVRARQEDFGHASLRQTSEQLVLVRGIPS